MDRRSRIINRVKGLAIITPFFLKLKLLWWTLLLFFMVWFSVPRLFVAIYEPFRIDNSPDQRYRLEFHYTLFTPPFNWNPYIEQFEEFTHMWPHALVECCRPGYVRLVRNKDNRSMGGFFYGNYDDFSIRWRQDSISIIGFYRWDGLPQSK